MKTKTNKVPLVGPRGRRELLDRIDELEKKIAELASNPPKTHVLKVLNSVADSYTNSIETILNALELDGHTPTYDEVRTLTPQNCTLYYDGNSLAIQKIYCNDSEITICGGYIIPNDNGYLYINIGIYNHGYLIIYEQ